MSDVISRDGDKSVPNGKEKVIDLLNDFVWIPFRAGVIGFILFALAVTIINGFELIIGSINSFKFSDQDWIICLIGSGFFFLFIFWEKIKDRRTS